MLSKHPDYLQVKASEFLNSYDFNEEPSHYAKIVTKDAKDNLIFLWNQWLAFNEAEHEQVFGITIGDGLGDLNFVEQLNLFHSYLDGVLEVYTEEINKDK